MSGGEVQGEKVVFRQSRCVRSRRASRPADRCTKVRTGTMEDEKAMGGVGGIKSGKI